MGESLRSQYAGLGYKALCKALGQRRKVVMASEKVCRTWLDQYATAAEPPAKKGRRAIEAPEVSAAASSSGPQAGIKLLGAKAVEEACGPRYRREVTDLGLGFAHRQMVSTLRTWGYDATRESCQEWLRTYRLSDGGKDGGAGVYRLSRQQLQRWHYVDKLSPTALQDRYRSECGVYAHRAHLIRWLKVISE